MRRSIRENGIFKTVMVVALLIACISMLSMCIHAMIGDDGNLDTRCAVFLVSVLICCISCFIAFDIIGSFRRFGRRGISLTVEKAISEIKGVKEEKDAKLVRDLVLSMVIPRYRMSDEELACIIEALTFGHEKRKGIEKMLEDGCGKEIAYKMEPVMSVWHSDEICSNAVFELENSNGVDAAENVAASILALGRDRGIEGLIDAVYAGIPVEDVIA